MDKPEFLYHYTSIDTLDKILSLRKIKFNRLDLVDDLNEKKSSDLGNLGMFVFVSCWTNSPKESIPLWKEYSGGMKGVRIKLPSNLFRKYIYENVKIAGISIIEKNKSLVPFDKIHGKNYLLCPFPEEFLLEVDYSSQVEDYIPRVFSSSSSHDQVDISKIGRTKRQEWSYQSEWRFRMFATPAPPPPKKSYDEYEKSFQELFIEAFKNRYVEENFLLLEMKDEAFGQMEIMLGPKCDKNSVEKVKKIRNEHNPNASIVKSDLAGQLR